MIGLNAFIYDLDLINMAKIYLGKISEESNNRPIEIDKSMFEDANPSNLPRNYRNTYSLIRQIVLDGGTEIGGMEARHLAEYLNTRN